MQQIVIDNIICNVHAKGEKAPVFIYINEPSIPVGARQITEALEQINSNLNYIFVEILINNWDKNLSPWPIKTNNREFDGNALISSSELPQLVKANKPNKDKTANLGNFLFDIAFTILFVLI